MVSRWVSLGALGYINMLEQLCEQGMDFTPEQLENLASVHARLGAVIQRQRKQPGDVISSPESSKQVRRKPLRG